MSFAARRRAVITLLVSIAACGDNAEREAAPVSCREECAPFACDAQGGSCFRFCTTEAQCATDHVCSNATCVGTECNAATADLCSPYACVVGTCASDCIAGPCAAGFYCRGDTNECVPQCTRRGDPICDGYVCDLGSAECEPYCLDGELGCAAGYVCDTDRCVLDERAPGCAAGCGTYACLPHLGRCATHCVDPDDCAAGATCVDAACT
jgi:hypothetical protein